MTARTPQPLAVILRLPAAIAAVTAAGLVCALVGDGLWDAVSWVALAIPIAVAAWGVARRG